MLRPSRGSMMEMMQFFSSARTAYRRVRGARPVSVSRRPRAGHATPYSSTNATSVSSTSRCVELRRSWRSSMTRRRLNGCDGPFMPGASALVHWVWGAGFLTASLTTCSSNSGCSDVQHYCAAFNGKTAVEARGGEAEPISAVRLRSRC